MCWQSNSVFLLLMFPSEISAKNKAKPKAEIIILLRLLPKVLSPFFEFLKSI